MDRSRTARERGRLAEEAVAEWFTARGYQQLARNYTAGKLGELDLVLEHEGTLCVVEVKARSGSTFGGPAASLTAGKLRRMRNTTLHFMQKQALMHKRVQFLAAIVQLNTQGDIMDLKVVPIYFK